jgi:aryl-alcohol dehydrogenase-like predicted oxidoreductase
VDQRALGSTGLTCSRLGWGAFKIGRTQGAKFPDDYALPTDEEAVAIVHAMLDLGITLIDTAPSYGCSEVRLGLALRQRRDDVMLVTKVGEEAAGQHDFTSAGAIRSLQESLTKLGTDHVDLLLVHSDGNDLEILNDEGYIDTLREFKAQGLTRAIGFSGKTPEGGRRALDWADALMIEYHLEDRSHEELIATAADRGVGVLLKKALASGHLEASRALGFVLEDSPVAAHISSVVIGSLHPASMAANARLVGGHRPG